MQRSSSVRYTYQDHQSIPEDHRRHEIIDGRLFVTPLPRYNHQRVAANLLVLLRSHAEKHGLGDIVGPITVHLHDQLVLEPDLVFIRKDRLEIVDPEGDVHGPPDLVIEILSPSTRSYDRNLKRKRYLESGVAELWLVDVDARQVDVWRSGSDEPERVREVLPWSAAGLECAISLADVFRGVERRGR